METKQETCDEGKGLSDITKCPKYEQKAEYLVSGYCPSCRADQASYRTLLLLGNWLLTGDSDAAILLGAGG